jgi:hypothetical protein
MSEEKKKYELTPEHREQLRPWADRWIKNAMRVTPQTADEKLDYVDHLNALYESADLKKPKTVLFVPSPFAACVIGGFAAAIVELGNKSKYTIKEMAKIVLDSADSKQDSGEKWFVSSYNVRKLNEQLELGDVGIENIKKVHNMWNGGNQLSAWVSYISFFRHIAKLPIDFTKWHNYERLCELGGPRIMHSDFCIVSDFPTKLTVNNENRPHNSDGAFCEWSDGCSMFSVNGVRLPSKYITKPETITVKEIETQSNLEIKRVLIDKYGKDRYIVDSKAELIHSDDFGMLYRKEIPGDEALVMVKVVNSTAEPDGTYKDYWIRVDPNAYGGVKTARAAVASTWRNEDGSLMFPNPEDYVCVVET